MDGHTDHLRQTHRALAWTQAAPTASSCFPPLAELGGGPLVGDTDILYIIGRSIYLYLPLTYSVCVYIYYLPF